MMWFLYGTLLDPLLKNMRAFVADFAGLKSGQHVLDVCCGTGAQVLEYGRRDIIATGIDINPAMLRIAERNRVREQLDNVSFQLGDAASMPFQDHCFDCVSISLGLHDKTGVTRHKVVSEMSRVVKQQGVLVLVDFQVPLPGNVWAILARSLEFMINGSHYVGFKDYVHNGGLDKIIETHNLVEERRYNIKSGLIAVVKARCVGGAC